MEPPDCSAGSVSRLAGERRGDCPDPCSYQARLQRPAPGLKPRLPASSRLFPAGPAENRLPTPEKRSENFFFSVVDTGPPVSLMGGGRGG